MTWLVLYGLIYMQASLLGQILMHILLKIMFVPVHFQNLQVV